MKRLICLSLVLTMMFFCCSCSSENMAASESQVETEFEVKPELSSEPQFAKLGFEVTSVHDVEKLFFDTSGTMSSFTITAPNKDYVCCSASDSFDTTFANFGLDNYVVFTSDDEHAAKEGYEWIKADFTFWFTDSTAINYGAKLKFDTGTYYDGFSTLSELANILDTNTIYTDTMSHSNKSETLQEWIEDPVLKTIDYKGNEYTIEEYFSANTYSSYYLGDTSEASYLEYLYVRYVDFTYEAHVPVGYDGTMIAFYNPANTGSSPSERFDEDTIFIRFD